MVMATAQEVELLGRQLFELNARMEEVHQQSSSTAMNAAAAGPMEAVRSIGQSVSKPPPKDMGPYAPGKDIDDLGLHVQRMRGYVRSCLSSNPESSDDSGDGDDATRTAV